jgi:Tol biopolymer transport system component
MRENSRQQAAGRKQKAAGSRQKAVLYCLLLAACSLLLLAVLTAQPPAPIRPVRAQGSESASTRYFFPVFLAQYPLPILFVSNRNGHFDIVSIPPGGGPVTNLTNSPNSDDIYPAWSPPHLPYLSGLNDARRRIAFASNRLDGNFEIYMMRYDGSNLVRLTYNNAVDVSPTWSPDGTKIAFASDRTGMFHIHVMNADGSGETQLTQSPSSGPASDRQPNWSPTLDKIVFVSDRDGDDEIYTVNPDGSALTRLTFNDAPDFDPRWSPDGRITFVSQRDGPFEIYTMNADGTNQTRLTQQQGINTSPSWSPDSSQIVFVSTRDSPASFVNPELYVMDQNGANVQRLTNDELGADDWQPVWWR